MCSVTNLRGKQETEGPGAFSLSTSWTLRVSGLEYAFVSGDSICLRDIPELSLPPITAYAPIKNPAPPGPHPSAIHSENPSLGPSDEVRDLSLSFSITTHPVSILQRLFHSVLMVFSLPDDQLFAVRVQALFLSTTNKALEI